MLLKLPSWPAGALQQPADQMVSWQLEDSAGLLEGIPQGPPGELRIAARAGREGLGVSTFGRPRLRDCTLFGPASRTCAAQSRAGARGHARTGDPQGPLRVSAGPRTGDSLARGDPFRLFRTLCEKAGGGLSPTEVAGPKNEAYPPPH
eukprot:NODE_4319_length_814_cov_44.087582_g3577_i0.p1 GENE.NODE_4319_length_814_cov_44.087582_g3577_i0~~NODE_4319_length_814_cov_44.087582_g3577_i0.p1  ORF type:complete len:148 (+),score=2.66 NODE_4319_length_814_cov_44.087582_g3577_i0:370-813(+)